MVEAELVVREGRDPLALLSVDGISEQVVHNHQLIIAPPRGKIRDVDAVPLKHDLSVLQLRRIAKAVQCGRRVRLFQCEAVSVLHTSVGSVVSASDVVFSADSKLVLLLGLNKTCRQP